MARYSGATTPGKLPMPLYESDLAHIQDAGFGGFAADAVPWILARLRDSPVAVRTVIDVGCGAGVTTRALTDAGFDVLAIEPSAPLVDIARCRAPAARFLNTSVYEAALEPCEAILAVGEVLTYHAPDADAYARLRRFFEDAATVLGRGGQLIFDVIVAAGAPLDARGWSAGHDWAVLYETREEPGARRLTRTIETFRGQGETYRRAREVHEVRVFDESAVRSWLEDAAFCVDTARTYGANPLAPRRVAFFATRR